MQYGLVPHPRMFDDDDPVLRRVREVTLTFPDAAEKVSHGIPAFYTTKVFAYYGGSENSASTSCWRSPTCCWQPGWPRPARSATPAASAG